MQVSTRLVALLVLVKLQQQFTLTHCATGAASGATAIDDLTTTDSPISANYAFTKAPGKTPQTLEKVSKKRSRLVIYDPVSGRQLDPLLYLPIVMGDKRKPLTANGNLVELPQLWNPCTCTEFMCMCCLGIRLGPSFNHQICAALEYNSAKFSLQMRINLNRRTVAEFGFSARTPPSICIPILLPLPFFVCLRLYDIRAAGGNVQICLSLVLNVLMNQLFEFHFDCVRFGVNGVQFFRRMEYQTEVATSTEDIFRDDEDRRMNVKLNEDYSGISIERDHEVAVLRKGRKRTSG